jgi:hypothetical protein
MKSGHCVVRAVGVVGVVAGVGGAVPAWALPVDFLTTNPTAEVRAEARYGTQEDLSGGPFSGFTGGLAVSFGAGIYIDEESAADAFASIDVDFTQTSITAYGDGGGDADSTGPFASSYTLALFDIFFTLTEAAPATFVYAVAGGTHASSSIRLATAGGDIIIDTSGTLGEIDGWTAVLPAGNYRLTAEAGNTVRTDDGWNGLFGGSGFDFKLTFPAPPPPAGCSPADIATTDGDPGPDNAIDNGDFSLFFQAFFADPSDPLHLSADIANTDGDPGADGTVDNGDFSLFFSAFFVGCP